MADDDQEYLKLPADERCVHKVWKARVSGYEDAAKQFNYWDGDDPNWKKYAPIVKKFVVDSNAVAQEKGLVATLAFVANCDAAGRTGSEITDGLVTKCLGAPKAKTKELAGQILLMLCEIEVHEKVIEDLIKGLTQKNPKVVSGCLSNMTASLKAFGAKVIKVSPLLKAAMPLLDHRDKTVREEGKGLIAESYRWVGAVMKQQLNGLKAVQLKELDEMFDQMSEGGKAKPERYLRSQIPTQATGGGADDADGGGGGGEDAEEEEEDAGADDPYDLIDPVDILAKIPKNFYELVEEKKWQLRKEALDALLPLTQTSKILNGDFNDVVRVLKKFIAKDTNVMLVALAAQCMAGLAKGLRGNFKNPALQCLPACLEKFKEKKINVLTGLRDAVDAFYPVLNVEGIQEDCLATLKHKTPSVVSETAKYLARCFSKCPPQLVTNKKAVKGYVSALMDRLSHADGTVRDAASEALGVLWKFLGEPTLMKLMPDLEAVKLAKIKEFAEKAELTGKPAAVVGGVAAAKKGAKVVKSGGGGAAAAKPASKPKPAGARKVSRPAAKRPSPEPACDEPEPADEEDEGEPVAEDHVPRVDISEKMNETFLAKMQDKNWKLRKEAMDEMKDIISSAKFVAANIGGLGPVLASRFTDTNKIISQQAVEIAKDLSIAMGAHVRGQMQHLVPGLLGSLCDSKPIVRAGVVACMDTLLEQTLIKEFFADEMLLSALTKGNHFAKQEVFKWLAQHLPEARSVPKDDLTAVVPMLYASVEDRNADVRKAAQEAVSAFMRHLGFPKMMAAADKLKQGSKSVLTPVLEKARESVPQPESKRAAKSAPAGRGGGAPTAVRGGVRPAVSGAPAEGGGRKTSRPGIGSAKPASAAASAGRKKGDDVDTSPLYSASNLKNARFKEEAKLKLLKWHFATPRQEFVDQLNEQMTSADFNKTLMTQMNHSDFKQHLKAIEALNGALSDVEALIANLDLILKWMTLRFFETNPSVQLRGLDYLNSLFTVLSEDQYHLHEYEASSFIPYLINKVGDPKDQIRNSIRSIFKILSNVYPASKFSGYLMEGIKSKNAKQRTECLDHLGYMIQNFGSHVLQPTVSVCAKEIAKQIGDRDNSVRNAALNNLTEIYFQDGEKLYRAVGNLPEKDMAMLEERIKRQSKTRPPPASMAPPPPQQAPTSGPGSRSGSVPPPSQRPGGGIPSRLQRPGTASSIPSSSQLPQVSAPPPSASATFRRGSPSKSNRPISGAFTLDLEKIDFAVDNMSDIKLVNHNLDEIFNDDPVRLPQRTLMGRRQFSPPSAASAHSALLQSPIAAARNPQMMMQQPRANLSEMPEAYEALDVVLAQILSQDSTTCIGALKQLEELIKDKDKVLLMSHRMDQLLSGCYMQYRHVLNNKMKTDNCDPSDVMRIFQYLTMVLMSMYHHAEITRTASTSAIHDLVHVIICVLLEPDVAGYPQGSQLIRALNVLTVKIVDRSDHTCITSAFLRLLRESVGNPCLAPKYVELVMKCLWKVIRSLANNGWMDDLNLDLVLADLHDFLKAYPSSYWKTQDSDTPVRTVKTVLHTLTKYKGEEILDHLTRIQDPENSELVAYLRKLLNSGIGKENSANGTEAESSGSAIDTNNKQQAQKSKAAQRFSKSDHETLADIFKKIGQKELTKQGLQELYNFKKQNPDANLSPFLDKSSQYFRDYIERGLKNIEMELGNGGVGSHASNGFGFGGGSGSVLSDVASGNAQQIAPHMQYMERLTKLREQGGLHSANSAVDGTVASSGVSSASSAYRISASSSVVSSASSYQRVEQRHQYEEVDESALAAEAEAAQQQQQQQAATAANVEDIRKRLERIKQSAF